MDDPDLVSNHILHPDHYQRNITELYGNLSPNLKRFMFHILAVNLIVTILFKILLFKKVFSFVNSNRRMVENDFRGHP